MGRKLLPWRLEPRLFKGFSHCLLDICQEILFLSNDRTSSRPTCRTKVHFSVLPVGRNKSQPISVVGCPTGWTLCSSMVHSIAMQRNMVAGSSSI